MNKVAFSYIIFTAAFFLIVFKLFSIQVLNPFDSENINNYLKTRKIVPERGKIFDRNGLPLSVNQTSYLLFLEPKKIVDKEQVFEKISSVLNIEEASLEAKLKENKDWIAIRLISEEQKATLAAKKLDGIGFEEKTQRFYPEASLAAQLLGFVGKNYKGEDVGYFGIEGYYDKDLIGLPGVIKSERDLLNRPILIGTQEKVEAENGRNLYLSIDKAVQEIVKKKLLAGMEKYQASQGCVTVADPYTLQILALSCLPDFDMDKYYLFSEEYFKNPVISNLFEPGSVFKPLIVAAALEEKKIKPNDFYEETGPVKIGEYTIKTWNDKYEGKITITRILEKSSNVGMVYIGERLGKKKIYQYLQSFGFGKPTDIDLQGEVGGYLKSENSWYPIDFSTVTFGQGIAVTQIQMLRAFSSLINGGQLMRPHVIYKITSQQKESEIASTVEKRTISSSTSQIIKKMLQSTVENGEIRWAKPKGYQIGGKTGTAQVPIAGHYDPSKTVASFIGFAPVEKPQFIMLVSLKEPKTSPWGSETAAPLFFDIAKELLIYYNIAPEQ